MTSFADRVADFPVDRIFLERWSPRAFTGEAISRDELMTVFEAARWAPSSYNSQPWRYVYALRDTPAWPVFLSLLIETNQAWARHAAALILALSKTTVSPRGEAVPSHSHSFDAGAAWANLALQATLLGWHAHGMVGLDMKRAAAEMRVPDGFRVEAALAIGRRGDPALLPERYRPMETPNGREKITSFAFEGVFRTE